MGGAAGHMMHPFECPDVKTGNDLLALFEEAKNKVGSVKIDGTNVSFKLVNTPDGRKEFAGDRGSYDKMDVMGLTATNLGERWPNPEHGMRSMYGLVLKILNDALSARDPKTGESVIKPELVALGMWDNPAKFINTEYVKGKTNQVAYPDSAKFLAFHGINHFYASAPKHPRQNQMARSEEMGYLPMPEEILDMKRGDRPRSTPIQFDDNALQSLVSKIVSFAEKEGFTVVHNIPTEHDLDINLEGLYNKTLGYSVSINLDQDRSLNLNLKQWLDKVKNPIQNGEFLKVKLATSKDAKPALSKIIYQELIINQTPLNQLLSPEASEQEGQIALDGAIIYYATLLLGADLLRSQKAAGDIALGLFGADMLNLSTHEGLVVLDRDEHPFCGGTQVKFTGEFIEKGQDSPFRQTNEDMLYEQNEYSGFKYVVMIPGGFKPPTAGHHRMINSYANHPEVQEVIIIQGPKDRDGITNIESRAIFELYGGFPNNVKFMVSRVGEKTPLQTAYELVKNQDFTGQYGSVMFSIGASVKGGDDSRVREFVSYFEKRKELLPEGVLIGNPPFVSDVYVRNGVELSASTMRKALADGDLDMVELHLPDSSFLQPVLKILDYEQSQKKTLGEELTLKGLFSLVESAMDKRSNLKEQVDLPAEGPQQPAIPFEAVQEKPRDFQLGEQIRGAITQALMGVLQQTEYGAALGTDQGFKQLENSLVQHINDGLIRQILDTIETKVDSSAGVTQEVSSMGGGNVQGHSGKRDEETLIREDEDDLIEMIMSKIISGE